MADRHSRVPNIFSWFHILNYCIRNVTEFCYTKRVDLWKPLYPEVERNLIIPKS